MAHSAGHQIRVLRAEAYRRLFRIDWGDSGRPISFLQLMVIVTVLLVGESNVASGSTPSTESAIGGVTVRIATFNASLNRESQGELPRDLSSPNNAQARAVAGIIRTVRPDILLINEFDYDERGESARLFRDNYLARADAGAQGGTATEAINYSHMYLAPSNTGMPTNFDLNRDGKVGGAEDARGFGQFPGQYSMIIYSRFPIEHRAARTFRNFRWRDMPNALLPDAPASPAPNDWYSAEALAILPLSSKSHWDVPVRIGTRTIHVLASHPTPPAFDGPEDRNGRRNHDEIRFWSDYLTPGNDGYIRDDRGGRGGLRGDDFVIAGDLNSDPFDGGSRHEAIRNLLAHERVGRGPTPASSGAAEATRLQDGVNATQRGEPRFDTSDFGDHGAGNLRVDYVLPSRSLRVCASGVFWPRRNDPDAELLSAGGRQTSDHRLVWVDISLTGACPRQP